MIKFFQTNDKYGYLSNWWLSYFTLHNITFNCVEQYMMWRKAMLFGDVYRATKILQEHNPAIIKSHGKKVQNYVDSEWSAIREEVVFEACLAKFTQNEQLRNKMLSFDKDTIFVECSPFDKIWGIGLGKDNPDSNNTSKWRGTNLLGKCLSRVRKTMEE